MDANTQTISTETILQLVAHPRRRTILHQLRETGDMVVPIDELTAAVAIQRTGPSPKSATNTPLSRNSEDNTSDKAELHHNHLPKLADAGVIEYDRYDGTVRYRSHDRVEALLEYISTHLE
ncbi:ArsR/SmtB family transcription factor [Halostagnicola bangensis]